MWVKSPLNYQAFVVEHGTVMESLHREDRTFEVPGDEAVESIGWVEELGLNDTAIDEAEYQSLAVEFKAYNDALPPVVIRQGARTVRRARIQEIHGKGSENQTTEEVAELTNLLAEDLNLEA